MESRPGEGMVGLVPSEMVDLWVTKDRVQG